LFSLAVTSDVTASFTKQREFLVVFACDNAVLPDVIVNGYKLEKLYVKGSIVSGNMKIPASDTMRFEVKLNGKTTSGVLLDPPFVTKMYCNNKTMRNRTYIGYNTGVYDYHFVWDTVNCDQYIFETGGTTPERRVILADSINEYTFTYPEIADLLTFDFFVSNGDCPTVGAKPGFTGDFGDGFCSISKSVRYIVEVDKPSTKSVKIHSHPIQTDKELYQKHIVNFMEYLESEQ
jgi:hypothetical protein